MSALPFQKAFVSSVQLNFLLCQASILLEIYERDQAMEFLSASRNLGASTKKKAMIEPKKTLTTLFPRSAEDSVLRSWETTVEAVGRASITASARSAMKAESQPRVGTLAQFLIPELRASSRYSMSISSNVSICSLTKLQER